MFMLQNDHHNRFSWHPSPHIVAIFFLVMRTFKIYSRGFPGGAVVKNPPANAGGTGSSPGLGRSHIPRSN